ncbi:MAG: tRNA pseudouridine(55) synthase TruB [Sporomusaceae bacterium]|nr:tRNA pseudouridine(55) synthase TruB [Sporomusaceae bacterium]
MISGVINLLKPPGMTSHDAVSFIRRVYGQKQVGHAGTLDPAAAGVLPVFLGRATRLVEYLAEDDKQYRVELRFGQETDSGDDTGNVIRTSELIPDSEAVRRSLASLLGQGSQIPPMHSAIKIGGRKLYELARQGLVVERKPRPITIYAISLLQMSGDCALFDVVCSKGTYIRTLCAEIGLRCQSAATMTFLLRGRVGECRLEKAVSLEEISNNPLQAIEPADLLLTKLPELLLSGSDAARFLNGQKINAASTAESDATHRVYDPDGIFIGIAKIDGDTLIPQKVFLPDV